MDKIDYKVLNILKGNGWETASDISKTIHLSASTVLDRTKKMEEAGITKGYTVRADSKTSGNDVTALMEISLGHSRFHDSFTKVIMGHPNIPDCYYLTGDYDFVIKITCTSLDELESVHGTVKSLPSVSVIRARFVLKGTKNVCSAIPELQSVCIWEKGDQNAMETLGYYNGTYDEIHKMTIPMNDRVCWFGNGAYGAGPCRSYNIFTLDEHADRFFSSTGLLRIQMPCTKEELKTLLKDLVRGMDTGDLLVYYQVTRGAAARAHEFPADASANLWVMLKPFLSPELTEKIKLITVKDTRFFHCNIKTLSLIPGVMAAQKASETGCKEAIPRGGDRVMECAHNNCRILKKGILHTAPADNLILPGTARIYLIDNCRKLGVPVSETPYTLEELTHVDEVLVTLPTKFCLFASEMDKKPVGGKAPELLRRIQDTVQTEFIGQTDPHLD